MYNFTQLDNSTSFITVIQVANDFTGQIFGLFILIAIFLTIYFGLKMYEPTREAFAAATFGVFICAIFLRILDIINNTYFAACIILLIGAVVMLINKD